MYRGRGRQKRHGGISSQCNGKSVLGKQVRTTKSVIEKNVLYVITKQTVDADGDFTNTNLRQLCEKQQSRISL
ncbi:conserved hypothetical protein [Leptospira interrogans serovar Manilae]|uniref:Uncharacterized protein n=1 Tax=Leptospira interrogans serovar Manilae TaxID=214675 RepID=A0AAQ1SN32_LEPIR|nr:conserved hypothetical protein [Leptospira interrogans serovar Manilae]